MRHVIYGCLMSIVVIWLGLMILGIVIVMTRTLWQAIVG